MQRKWFRNSWFWDLVEQAGSPSIPKPGLTSEHSLPCGAVLHLIAYDDHCIAAMTRDERAVGHFRQEYPLQQATGPVQQEMFAA